MHIGRNGSRMGMAVRYVTDLPVLVLCTAAVPARSSTDKKYNSCDIICSFLELCIFYGLEYGSFFSVGFAFNLFCVGNVSLQLG